MLKLDSENSSRARRATLFLRLIIAVNLTLAGILGVFIVLDYQAAWRRGSSPGSTAPGALPV